MPLSSVHFSTAIYYRLARRVIILRERMLSGPTVHGVTCCSIKMDDGVIRAAFDAGRADRRSCPDRSILRESVSRK